MCAKVIPDEIFSKLELSLKKYVQIKAISSTGNVIHVVVASTWIEIGYLRVAMEEASLEDAEYDILLEYETNVNAGRFGERCKFINYGKYFINDMLAEKFGGCVSNNRYWILYDEGADSVYGTIYGYKGENLPTAEEVIRYITELID